MPARRLLEGASFEPEAVQMLCAVYDRVRRELHDTGQPEIVNEIIAERILLLAEKGERDPDQLCARTLTFLTM